MRVYSFQIGPAANFSKRRRRTGKSPGIFAPELILSALKTLSPGKGRKPIAKDAPRPWPSAEPATSSLRETIAARQSAKDVIATRQMRYGTYAISTSQLRDGRWVASFGRRDSGSICADGKSQPIATTKPYFAETLAIATAQTRIDALAAGKNTHLT